MALGFDPSSKRNQNIFFDSLSHSVSSPLKLSNKIQHISSWQRLYEVIYVSGTFQLNNFVKKYGVLSRDWKININSCESLDSSSMTGIFKINTMFSSRGYKEEFCIKAF